jgi:hypothetical protein
MQATPARDAELDARQGVETRPFTISITITVTVTVTITIAITIAITITITQPRALLREPPDSLWPFPLHAPHRLQSGAGPTRTHFPSSARGGTR